MSVTKSQIRSKIVLDQRWLERAVLAIDARQEVDERAEGVTVYDNKRGWNAADAKHGSYLAKYIRTSRRDAGSRLSGRFVQEARNMMHKYCGQLARIAEQHVAIAA